MLQYDIKVVEDPLLGEITQLRDDSKGVITVVTENATMQHPDIAGPDGVFGNSFVATFSPDDRIELRGDRFKPLLTLDSPFEAFPKPTEFEKHPVLTRVIDVGPAGEIAYERLITDQTECHPIAEDGFYVFYPKTNSTRVVPPEYELLGLNTVGNPIVRSEEGITALAWDRKNEMWIPQEFFIGGYRAQYLAGDKSGYYLAAPVEGETHDENGLPLIHGRKGSERANRLEKCLTPYGLVGDVAFGVGLEKLRTRLAPMANYWIDGSPGYLFGPEQPEISRTVAIPLCATQPWGADHLLQMIGNERQVQLRGENLHYLDYKGPVMWHVSERDMRDGRNIRGESLEHVIDGTKIIEAKGVANGVVHVETDDVESALLVPKNPFGI